MKIIAIEEHFMSERVNERYNEIQRQKGGTPAQLAKLKFVDDFVHKGSITEVGSIRLNEMRETGVDVQILSYGNNSQSHLEPEYAVPLCKLANEELASFCAKYPDRFYGFAVLPALCVPEAVKELERCVRELHLKGVIFNGECNGHFFDEETFFPIFEAAARLHVPVMFHPGEVNQKITEHYYMGSWPMQVSTVFSGHGIGWHYDAGIQYLRAILSGMFDRLPELKMICGHWGELIPYYFNRLDDMLPTKLTGLKQGISDYFRQNIFATPSGMYYEDDLMFCLKKLGADRIMWASDYPYCHPGNAATFIEGLGISESEKEKIAHTNAEKLFAI